MKFYKLYLLAIQSTYHDVQIAVFHDNQQIKKEVIEKSRASAELIPAVNLILSNSNINLKDLSFIAVNQGPAPFTTLRVVIASMNGIAFATSLPLVGVDGLKALLIELEEGSEIPAIVLLDAFSNDIYYGFRGPAGIIETGSMPVDMFLLKIKNIFKDKPFRFVGNGAILHRELIKNEIGNQVIIVDTLSTCSIDVIARIGLEQWNKKYSGCKQILPLYLKKQWWHE